MLKLDSLEAQYQTPLVRWRRLIRFTGMPNYLVGSWKVTITKVQQDMPTLFPCASKSALSIIRLTVLALYLSANGNLRTLEVICESRPVEVRFTRLDDRRSG